MRIGVVTSCFPARHAFGMAATKNALASISTMEEIGKESVTWVEIDETAEGQRVDNFLLRQLKGVPKSHVYRILRSGEVRVNSGRVDATYRLEIGDKVRIPPVRVAKPVVQSSPGPVKARFEEAILFEDDALLVINKPAGMAVHGGSGISLGVIEQLRRERPTLRFLELAHRLDKETSGVLIIAKKRSALTKLHDMMRDGSIDKRYKCLVKGKWPNARQAVKLPLYKYLAEDGERRVRVSDEGKAAHTIFTRERAWPDCTLLEAELKTGRTHQIRVHLAHLGYPILGDDKYGDFPLNKALAKKGLKRMALHAFRVQFQHPLTGEALSVEAELPKDLAAFMNSLDEGATL